MHCIQNTVKITILLYINSIPLCCKVSYVLFYCNTFHPRGRRHVATSSPICVWTFQSTPPAKAETVCVVIQRVPALISIHSTREGGDETYSVTKNGSTISIHSTREGGDYAPFDGWAVQCTFQSTPPAKAETYRGGYTPKFEQFQSTPPAKAETPRYVNPDIYSINFNPLHPRRRRRLPIGLSMTGI